MRRFVTTLVLLFVPVASAAQIPTIREHVGDLERRDGFFPLYWNAGEAKLLLEIPRAGEEFLYLTSLATGVGSLDLGLDRGTIGNEYIARFDRVGSKMLLVLTNPGFRANSDNTALQRSVDESFPTSTIAALDIVAEESGRVLVDGTPFFVSDVMDVIGRLRGADQGPFNLDRARSYVYEPRTRAFPNNTEIEVTLTFTSDRPGAEVRRHAPDGRALTLREHHSFVRLPDDRYQPRAFDPRAGFFPVVFWDFAKPLDQDYPSRYIVRHRLVKRVATAPISDPVEPIVYYMDPGIPEPYRSAFRDGAMWWNTVFEAAGFRNAFRVEDMPPDMDPMDARYHVIQWVHRTEPGYSIGPSIVDPRTGEIIKAAVRMDSYRSMMDYDIYAGTLPVLGAGAEADDLWITRFAPDADGEAFAMARRRQHSAHEVGHTLGLAHNFSATSYGRASVMDYPAPLIELRNGRLNLSNAYRPGPGAWDSLAIRYGYTTFSADAEAAGLEAIIAEGIRRGLTYVTNPDEASASSFPEATTWVNGTEMVAELERMMGLRRFLIDRFDERAIAPGEPMALLTQRFTRVYLSHRFTLDAAIKAVGGMAFRYAVRGDAAPATRMVPPERQRRALAAVLQAIEPAQLAIPERVLALMAPRPPGYASSDRAFGSAAGPAFDQLGAARTLASDVVGGLFHRQRLARVAAFATRDANAPALDEVLGTVLERTWASGTGGEHAALRRVVQRVVADRLIELAADDEATVEVRAAAEWALRTLRDMAAQRGPLGGADAAHLQLVASDIARFLDRPAQSTDRSRPRPMPAGTPIGGRR